MNSELLKYLEDVLLGVDEFNNDRALQDLFADKRISPWQKKIPSATSVYQRVIGVTTYLNNKRNRDFGNRNALVLLLEVLAERVDKADSLHHELLKLANTIEDNTSSANELLQQLATQPPAILEKKLVQPKRDVPIWVWGVGIFLLFLLGGGGVYALTNINSQPTPTSVMAEAGNSVLINTTPTVPIPTTTDRPSPMVTEIPSPTPTLTPSPSSTSTSTNTPPSVVITSPTGTVRPTSTPNWNATQTIVSSQTRSAFQSAKTATAWSNTQNVDFQATQTKQVQILNSTTTVQANSNSGSSECLHITTDIYIEAWRAVREVRIIWEVSDNFDFGTKKYFYIKVEGEQNGVCCTNLTPRQVTNGSSGYPTDTKYFGIGAFSFEDNGFEPNTTFFYSVELFIDDNLICTQTGSFVY